MKISRPSLSALCLLAAALCLQAQNQPAPAKSSAAADAAALEALGNQSAPDNFTVEQRLTWLDRHNLALKSGALAFYSAHPADPRRWDFIMQSVLFPPLFIKSFGPDVETKRAAAIITDEPAKAEWLKQSATLLEAMAASTDASLDQKEEADWIMFVTKVHAVTAAKDKGESYDYSPLRALFDAHVAKYPQVDGVAEHAANYLNALERELKVPGPTNEGWKHLLDAPNEAVRNLAAAQFRLAELMSKPMEMVFTAVDGRAVDLKSLHGKVVLIDFWATWCGPCKAEIPNVKKVYAAYHDKGFEVLGIALEDGKLTPKDKAEQAAAKLAKAKQLLTDFTTANAMPWPQYFDGRFWKNEISTQYAIQSIPAMFLLDQNGMIVSTNARGEALETTVKKLLKL